jgi:hypothetical protein
MYVFFMGCLPPIIMTEHYNLCIASAEDAAACKCHDKTHTRERLNHVINILKLHTDTYKFDTNFYTLCFSLSINYSQ